MNNKSSCFCMLYKTLKNLSKESRENCFRGLWTLNNWSNAFSQKHNKLTIRLKTSFFFEEQVYDLVTQIRLRTFLEVKFMTVLCEPCENFWILYKIEKQRSNSFLSISELNRRIAYKPSDFSLTFLLDSPFKVHVEKNTFEVIFVFCLEFVLEFELVLVETILTKVFFS